MYYLKHSSYNIMDGRTDRWTDKSYLAYTHCYKHGQRLHLTHCTLANHMSCGQDIMRHRAGCGPRPQGCWCLDYAEQLKVQGRGKCMVKA
jgi:hypothetical protein